MYSTTFDLFWTNARVRWLAVIEYPHGLCTGFFSSVKLIFFGRSGQCFYIAGLSLCRGRARTEKKYLQIVYSSAYFKCEPNVVKNVNDVEREELKTGDYTYIFVRWGRRFYMSCSTGITSRR